MQELATTSGIDHPFSHCLSELLNQGGPPEKKTPAYHVTRVNICTDFSRYPPFVYISSQNKTNISNSQVAGSSRLRNWVYLHWAQPEKVAKERGGGREGGSER